MIHELANLMRDLFVLMGNNPFGTFLLLVILIWAVERTIRTIANRNKPTCECECCANDEDDLDDDDEDTKPDMVIMGGKKEDK